MAWNAIEYASGIYGFESRGFRFTGTYRINDKVYAPPENFPSKDVGNGAPWWYDNIARKVVFRKLTHTLDPRKLDYKFQSPIVIDSAMLMSKPNAEYDISTNDKMTSVLKYLSDKAWGYEDL